MSMGNEVVTDAMVEAAARAGFDEACRGSGLDPQKAWAEAEDDEDASEQMDALRKVARAMLEAALAANGGTQG